MMKILTWLFSRTITRAELILFCIIGFFQPTPHGLASWVFCLIVLMLILGGILFIDFIVNEKDGAHFIKTLMRKN